MTILQNVSKGSFVKGSALLIVLAGTLGVYLTRWGLLGFFVTGVPLWCFGVIAAVGGVLFFLAPMIFGSASVAPVTRSWNGAERMLFLYLRPFELDARNVLQLMVGASAGVLAYLALLKGFWIPFSFLPMIINISKEQSFHDALAPLGEFIACGRPGERLQPVGASRVYVEGDWRREITEYMARAKLVIVRPGDSPSIRWEVGQVLATVPPERILFYLRFRGRGERKERAYETFRACVRARLHAELPERLGHAQYLMFDTSGRPHFVREADRPAELIRQIFSRSGNAATDRFRPVLKALNIKLPPQPNNLLNNAVHVFLWLSTLILITSVIAAAVFVLLLSSLLALRLLGRALGV
jgi:hypothetical protein